MKAFICDRCDVVKRDSDAHADVSVVHNDDLLNYCKPTVRKALCEDCTVAVTNFLKTPPSKK